MAGYPSPVLITGAGSELAQGLRARLEARKNPFSPAAEKDRPPLF